MKKILLSLFLLIPFRTALGDYLAVLPCEIEAEEFKKAGKPVHYTLLERASKITTYEIMTRENIFTILKEKNIDPERCVEAECAVDYGRYLGAERILTCMVTKVGRKVFIYLTLYDTETGRVITSEKDSCRCTPAQLVDFIGRLGERVFSAEKIGRGDAQLFIRAETPNIEFDIDDGAISGKVQRERLIYLKPGPHKIRFRKKGYQTIEEEFYATEGRVKTITALLPPEVFPATEKGEGYLDIVSEPDGAEIIVDGKKQINPDGSPLTTNTTLKLSAGEHTIILRRELYKPSLRRIIVRAGGFDTHRVKLEPNYGTLHIESSPSSADVYIDGIKRGITPLTLDKIEAKAYIIKVSKSLYHDVEETVYVEPLQTTKKTFVLPPAFGSLILTGTKGAEVFIDGKKEGEIPFYKEVVLPGEHIIEVRKRYYKLFRKTVMVKEGEELKLTAKLIENYGFITVIPSLKDAPIKLDGKVIGKGEVRNFKVDAGEHRLEVGNPEIHRVWRRTIAVGKLKRKRYNVNLRYRTGKVVVITTPREANVYVDGRFKGKSPLSLTLVRGEHTIRLSKRGYTDVKRSIKVEEGEIQELRVSLPRFKPATLILRIRPSGEVFVEGEKKGEGKRVSITVPSKKRIEVEVKKRGYRTTKLSLYLEPDEAEYKEIYLKLLPPRGILTASILYTHPPVNGFGGGFEFNIFPQTSFFTLGFGFSYIYGQIKEDGSNGKFILINFPLDLRLSYLILRGEGYVYHGSIDTLSEWGGGFGVGGGLFLLKKPYEIRAIYTYRGDVGEIRFEGGWVW